MKLGFAFAGANAYRAEKMSTVKEVVNSLLEGYARAFSAAVSGESLGPSPAL
jgi:hypothetical protein